MVLMRYSVGSLLANALTRQQTLETALARARAQACLRRRDRRRRRAWARHRLLPRQGARHHQRRGGREGLISAPAMSGAIRRSSAPTICLPGNIPFYEWSMKLWEGLEQDFNYNAMVSQRGVLNLFHSDAQRDAYARRGNAMRLHGVDAELLDRDQVKRSCTLPRFRECALSDPGRAAATARRDGAPRCGGLGLCARRRPARRRHHPELRGDRHSASRMAASSASRRHAALSGRRRSALAVRRQLVAGRCACRPDACRSKAMSCRPSSRRA